MLAQSATLTLQASPLRLTILTKLFTNHARLGSVHARGIVMTK
jgi:hypothetical protein